MLRPGKLKHGAYAHARQYDVFDKLPELFFKTGETLLFDDEDTVVTDSEISPEADWWRACVSPRYRFKFYIHSEALQATEESSSFRSMIGFLQEVFDDSTDTERYARNLKKRWKGDELFDNLYYEYTNCKSKESWSMAKRREAFGKMLEVAKSRPAGARLEASSRREGHLSCPINKLHRGEIQDALKSRFWDFYGNLSPHPSLKAKPKGLEAMPKEGEMKACKKKGPGKDNIGRVETSEHPFEFKFYLNVLPGYVDIVAKKFIDMIDVPATEPRPRTRMVRLNTMDFWDRRLDTIIITVGSYKSLEITKEIIRKMTEQHPEYFSEGTIPFVEGLGKGCGWCEDTGFENVWEMSPDLMEGLRRFIVRVGNMLEDRRKRWFKGDAEKRALAKLETQYRQALKEVGTPDASTFGMDRKNLLEMNALMLQLGGVGLSELPLKWLEHFQKVKTKIGNPRVFLLHRLQAVEDSLDEYPITFHDFLRSMMLKFEERNVDFYRPHLNLPIKPFEDEDMVVVDLGQKTSTLEDIPEADQDFMGLYNQQQTRPKAETSLFKATTGIGRMMDQVMKGKYEELGPCPSFVEAGAEATTVNVRTASAKNTSVLHPELERKIADPDDFLKEEHLPAKKDHGGDYVPKARLGDCVDSDSSASQE
ncbi:hypothetical protein [Fulvitalea axinellae]